MTAPQPTAKALRTSFEQPTMWPPAKPVLVAKADPKPLKRAAA